MKAGSCEDLTRTREDSELEDGAIEITQTGKEGGEQNSAILIQTS